MGGPRVGGRTAGCWKTVMHVVTDGEEGRPKPKAPLCMGQSSCRYPLVLNLNVYSHRFNQVLQLPLPSKTPIGVRRQQALEKTNSPLMSCTPHARNLAENHATESGEGPAQQSSGIGTSHCPLAGYLPPSQLFVLWSWMSSLLL